MRKIKLSDAEAGMVLAQPIMNANGVTLAGAGTTLSERLIQRFETADVDEMWIESDQSVDSGQAALLKQKLEKRFARAGESKEWTNLHEILLDRIDQRVDANAD